MYLAILMMMLVINHMLTASRPCSDEQKSVSVNSKVSHVQRNSKVSSLAIESVNSSKPSVQSCPMSCALFDFLICCLWQLLRWGHQDKNNGEMRSERVEWRSESAVIPEIKVVWGTPSNSNQLIGREWFFERWMVGGKRVDRTILVQKSLHC